MLPEALERTWNMTRQQWHQHLRKAFRCHLFQFAGSYEMVIFFIVAPFNNDNLLVFHHFADEVPSEQVADKERKRCILERSKDYVRSRRVVPATSSSGQLDQGVFQVRQEQPPYKAPPPFQVAARHERPSIKIRRISKCVRQRHLQHQPKMPT